MHSTVTFKAFLIAVLLIASLSAVLGLKNNIELKKANKPAVYLETFVFAPGGVLNISATIKDAPQLAVTNNLGVFAIISKSYNPKFAFVDSRCPLDPNLIAELNANSTSLKFQAFRLELPFLKTSMEVPRSLQGVWSLHFVICGPIANGYSAKLELSMDNVDVSGKQTYLSAGDVPLPYIYLLSGLAITTLLFIWTRMMMSPERTISGLHWIMLALLCFKVLATFSESFMYFTMASTGSPKGWNIAFYVFQTFRALFLFLVVLMIGSGWQMVKAYLTDQDRYLFWVVIPLQVTANIGINICEEYNIRNLWFYLFHLLDIICCMLVLMPIIKSIQALQSKADADDKIQRLVRKLEHLRHFYLILVGYIYVTRVFGSLLNSFLPAGITWISSLVVELSTISFYLLSGYEFRPARDNALFHSDDEILDREHPL
jgi:hypothetical protein